MSKPNGLFIFTDDQRFDTISDLGNSEIQTPVSQDEIAILRDLAERLAELSTGECNRREIRNWTRRPSEGPGHTQVQT
ncbi:MAG: hypothetical protein QGG53_10440 [Planctomycetota bacterium]|nr:hypothetical protein [Planctomycetota bacterium]